MMSARGRLHSGQLRLIKLTVLRSPYLDHKLANYAIVRRRHGYVPLLSVMKSLLSLSVIVPSWVNQLVHRDKSRSDNV